ncbi:MAG: hypothetical protein COY39_04265 [Alphaproteobacteria bacterium CG_4_10_14_0_8_um_filter_37_21]|nr:MAG: hypothetical protein COY39_04265 [Alphaproteobacteria bacterium CG_4_10_14_0_8_um_filter_37_21]
MKLRLKVILGLLVFSCKLITAEMGAFNKAGTVSNSCYKLDNYPHEGHSHKNLPRTVLKKH